MLIELLSNHTTVHSPAVITSVFVIIDTMSKPGGLHAEKDADSEVQAVVDQVKSAAEGKTGKSYSTFTAKRVATQVGLYFEH